jgi:predicted ribonuclease YlaK
MVSANKFKGQAIFGSVFLEISERSELSRLANELL